jgi:hypothetical protein
MVVEWSHSGKGKRRLKSPDALLSNVHGAMVPLLPVLFESPVVGVALFDSQIHFRAINGALTGNERSSRFSSYDRFLRNASGPASESESFAGYARSETFSHIDSMPG